MGNSQTKEARSPLSPSYRNRSLSDQSRSPYHGSRSHRSSRPDLSFLGIGSGSSERDAVTHEHRRETKQDREARRQERERAARLRERERSMKEEHVDGAYLVTQGVYVGVEDFNKAVVRQLMVCPYTYTTSFFLSHLLTICIDRKTISTILARIE